jgi:uncharacterized peroxidase-related enzyme
MSDIDLHSTFTLDYLGWTPWVPRATDTDLAPDLRERAEAAIASRQNSDYIAVLTNDYPAWKARDAVHHHTFAGDEPLQVAYRELGSTTASRHNGCVFCASVHARIYDQKSGRREVIDRFLAKGFDAELPQPEQAIVDLARKVTVDPESLTAADLQPLRDQGFSDAEILDIANYAAFFANANRLMLTLGEPVYQRPYRG